MLFEIFLTVYAKGMGVNSRLIRSLNIRYFYSMFPLALLALLLKLVLLLGERVFKQFRKSVCSVAASLSYVWALVCFSLVCLLISLPFI